MLSKSDLADLWLTLDKDELAARLADSTTMLADSTTIVELQRLHINELKDEVDRLQSSIKKFEKHQKEYEELYDNKYRQLNECERALDQARRERNIAVEKSRRDRCDLDAYRAQLESKQQEQDKPKKSWYTRWFGGV
jgi:chromosome segregation ATPase